MDAITEFAVNQGVAAVVLGALLLGLVKATKWAGDHVLLPVVASHKEYLDDQTRRSKDQQECMFDMKLILSKMSEDIDEIHTKVHVK